MKGARNCLRAVARPRASGSQKVPSRLLSTSRVAASSQYVTTANLGHPTTRQWPQNRPVTLQKRAYAAAAKAESLQKTPLYDLHVAHGGKMVPFGGFQMPVQYSSLSIIDSHKFTRTKASLFDVSHMVQRHFSGPRAVEFLQKVMPVHIPSMAVRSTSLSALLWKTGGICDDCVVMPLEDELVYVVTNAACREKDDAFFAEELAAFGEGVKHEKLDGWGLIALQGPVSMEILTEILAEDQKDVYLPHVMFGNAVFARVKLQDGSVSSPLLMTRGGYTGEDGFEIRIPAAETVAVTETLLKAAGPERLQLAGLGARDSLRLEAGMCLYGHDLNDETTLPEAGLGWTISKERRSGDAANFNGADIIIPQLTLRSKGGKGTDTKRIGLIVDGAPAREGAQIVTSEGEVVGKVTSGCPSPTLGQNIAMGYVKTKYQKTGTELGVLVRGKVRLATVAKMPFVPSKYWTKERFEEGKDQHNFIPL